MTGTGPDFISVSWTEPEPSQQNGIIRHYLIYLTPDSSPSSTTTHTTPSSSTSHTLTALHPYTSYHITVAAVTIAPGPQSRPVEAQTGEDGEFKMKS